MVASVLLVDEVEEERQMRARSSASSTIPYYILTYIYCHLVTEMRLPEIAEARMLAHAPALAISLHRL